STGAVEHNRYIVIRDLLVELRHGERIADEGKRLFLMPAHLQETIDAGGAIVERNIDVADAELLDALLCIHRIITLAGVPGETTDVAGTPFRAKHGQDQ